MSDLDAGVIRRALGDAVLSRLAALEVFDEIESTNSYLMRKDGPPPGQLLVAVTDNQTAGRGRHGRTWESPPGTGLCLSLAFSYADKPEDLPALTLAIGMGIIDALEAVGVTGVNLKWPNDLVAGDGKLGGILTETQSRAAGAISVVTGVGLNIDLGSRAHLSLAEQGSMRRIADLAGHVGVLPSRNELVASIVDRLCAVFADYACDGFAPYADRWAERDWLLGRTLTVDTPQRQVTGRGAGVATDGALMVATASGETLRISSGTVAVAGEVPA